MGGRKEEKKLLKKRWVNNRVLLGSIECGKSRMNDESK
jgi:hypothetical protein